ncbi:GldG family protein [Natribaculum luteum]|uniref:GldG family protein n=1 Tax=Natribaculum luteum TaxID=1586232 RepID=A0ABD5P1H0_9EURY|nr:GldG family protein [Natribaculum luteum]
MSVRSRFVVFAAVVLVTVAGVGVAGLVTEQGATERPTVDQQQFQPSAIDAPTVDRGGAITYDDDGESKTVVIDVAHSNDVAEEDLEPVVSALTAGGHTVQYHESSDDFDSEPAARLNETLRGADALIVVDPGTRYTAEEAAGVSAFADAGGRVLFAAGPDSGGLGGLLGLLIGAQPTNGEFASVTSPVGIAYDTGYLYNMEEYENNYKSIYATPSSDSELTDGVDRVVFDSPTQVVADGQTLLTTLEGTEHSETREAGEYGVVARSGNAIAVGDPGFMSSQNYNRADNDVLLGNVLEFLVTGEKEAGVPEEPSTERDTVPQSGSSAPRVPGE